MRNFSFDPDTGRVTAVQYDELGLAYMPENWVMLYELDVRSVLQLQTGRLTLQPQAQPLLLCSGGLGRIVASAMVSCLCTSWACQGCTILCLLCLGWGSCLKLP